jgi:hypothetical protein
MDSQKVAIANGAAFETTETELSQDEKEDTISAAQLQKLESIDAACRSIDIPRLRGLADSEGGFVTDAARRSACAYTPSLLPYPIFTHVVIQGQYCLEYRRRPKDMALATRRMAQAAGSAYHLIRTSIK